MLTLSLVRINIHNTNIRGSSQLNYGHGDQNTQANGDTSTQLHPRCSTQTNDRHMMGHVTERRVEAQRKIRRKLDEVSTMGPEAILGIDVVALRAMEIMSIVDVRLF